MTIQEFYNGLPEALGAGEDSDFQPETVFRQLPWWDSLVLLRLLDYLETSTGTVFPAAQMESVTCWEDLVSKLDLRAE